MILFINPQYLFLYKSSYFHSFCEIIIIFFQEYCSNNRNFILFIDLLTITYLSINPSIRRRKLFFLLLFLVITIIILIMIKTIIIIINIMIIVITIIVIVFSYYSYHYNYYYYYYSVSICSFTIAHL